MIPILFFLLAADPLTAILDKMDANSASFKGASTSLKRITYNAGTDIKTEANGVMLLKRAAPHDLRALITFTDAAPQQVAVGKGVAQLFYKTTNTIQEAKIGGKYQTAFEQFYLLAFGGSGKDLAANYDISYIGAENLGAVATDHLQLVPKNPEVKKNFPKLELWVISDSATPAQLKLSSPAGDTNTFIYTNVKMNPKISDSDLRLKGVSGATVTHPGQ